MSLLLKALKQAGDKSAAGTRNPSATLADSLSLEPMTGAADTAYKNAASWENAAPGKHSAARAAWYTPWLTGQRSLVPVVALLATLFMVIYGAFVYWQTRAPSTLAAAPIPASLAALAPSFTHPLPAPQPLSPVAPLPSGGAAPGIRAPAAAPRRSVNAAPPAGWGSGVLKQSVSAAPAPPPSPQPVSRKMPEPVFIQPAAKSQNQLEQAYQAFQAGRTREARALYQQIPDGANNVDVQLGLAAIALHDNNMPASVRHYQRVLELEPRNSTANSALIGMMGDADPDASEARLKSLIASQPAAQLYFALGNLYAGQSRWPDAEQAYFEAYQNSPANADYAYNLAVSLDHINQRKPALVYYQKARDLMQPGNTQFDPARLEARIDQLKARQE